MWSHCNFAQRIFLTKELQMAMFLPIFIHTRSSQFFFFFHISLGGESEIACLTCYKMPFSIKKSCILNFARKLSLPLPMSQEEDQREQFQEGIPIAVCALLIHALIYIKNKVLTN